MVKQMRISAFLPSSLGLLLTAALVGCGTASTPSTSLGADVSTGTASDLQAYVPSTFSTQALKNNVLAVNAKPDCVALNLTAPVAVSFLRYGDSVPLVNAGVLSGTCSITGDQPFSASIPPSFMGDSYVFVYGSGSSKTLTVPRVSQAPAGLAVEQIANLSAQAAVVSYSRRGEAVTRLEQTGAGSAGGLYLDLKPGETTFFFRSPATQALIAKGTFALLPGDSVAVLLVGGATKQVVVASARTVAQPTYFKPAALSFGANQVAELSFDNNGEGYLAQSPEYDAANLGVYPLATVGTVTKYLLISHSAAGSSSRFSVAGTFAAPLANKAADVSVTASAAHLAQVTPNTSAVDPAPTDLTAGSVIPFSSRKWEILNPSGVLGSVAPAPTVGAASIDQNGLFSPPASAGQFRVRVTNRSKPSQYAETIVEVIDFGISN